MSFLYSVKHERFTLFLFLILACNKTNTPWQFQPEQSPKSFCKPKLILILLLESLEGSCHLSSKLYCGLSCLWSQRWKPWPSARPTFFEERVVPTWPVTLAKRIPYRCQQLAFYPTLTSGRNFPTPLNWFECCGIPATENSLRLGGLQSNSSRHLFACRSPMRAVSECKIPAPRLSRVCLSCLLHNGKGFVSS